MYSNHSCFFDGSSCLCKMLVHWENIFLKNRVLFVNSNMRGSSEERVFSCFWFEGQVHCCRAADKIMRTTKWYGTDTSLWTQLLRSMLTIRTLIKAWKLQDKTLFLYGVRNELWFIELLSLWKNCNEYCFGGLYNYWKWSLHHIVHLCLICQQGWQLICCYEKSKEHYGHIYGCRINLH